MTWEIGSTDQQRLRAGYLVLSIGAFILLFAWVMAVVRGPEGVGEIAIHQKLEPPEPQKILPQVGIPMVAYGILLIVVLFTSLIALLRISRNFRRHFFSEPSQPTSTSDVWKMHRVPDDVPAQENLPDDDGIPEDPDKT